jgi:hypothetical protein
MMVTPLLLKRLMLLMLLLLVLPACQRQPVRHFSADVSLLVPGRTTKQEVLSSWGAPEQRQLDEKGDTWIYYQANKSFLRRTPLLGGKMGREEYDVAIITFRGEVVRSCTYRSFDEHDFERTGISSSETLEHR